MRKSLLLIISFLFSAFELMAQNTDDNSVMASNGKIYVVLAVCLTILAGIVLYLIRIDRKISRLEKKND
jgi:predicted tellurium resistance membrane protein TerC